MNPEEPEISVGDYLNILNSSLVKNHARVIGEVYDFKPCEGLNYLFFSVKDKDSDSVLHCFIWRRDYILAGVELEDGLEVIISGHPEVYKARGNLSFQTKGIELVGEGALKKAYEKLKAQLEREGLLDKSRKRSLPQFPQKVGLITSNNGAAKGDFLANLGKHGFKVTFIDSRVEGQSAVAELYWSIKTFEKKAIDVLVIIRGGGSLESLLPFNNEILARQIAKFPVPVLVGVGHERDISLIGLIADKMVSTPTATANSLNSSWDQASQTLELSKQKMTKILMDEIAQNKSRTNNLNYLIQNKFQRLINRYKDVENIFVQRFILLKTKKNDVSKFISSYGLKSCSLFREKIFHLKINIGGRLSPSFKKFSDLIYKLKYKLNLHSPGIFINNKIKQEKQQLLSIDRILKSYNPEKQLKNGYGIISKNGAIVRRVEQIAKGDLINIKIFNGTFDSEIKKIN